MLRAGENKAAWANFTRSAGLADGFTDMRAAPGGSDTCRLMCHNPLVAADLRL